MNLNRVNARAHIIDTLSAELATLTRAAKESFAAATDPDSKAENKYDTRTLEASYVARGQAQRVVEVQEALGLFEAMRAAEVTSAVVSLGSLVAVELPGEVMHCFIGPAAGGTQVEVGDVMIDVVTPASPLGQKLIGKAVTETIPLNGTLRGVIRQIW